MVDEAFSRALSFKARLRSLESQLAAESAKKIAVQQRLDALQVQNRNLQAQFSAVEGRKNVGSRKRLIEDEIRSSKLYQELLRELDCLRGELDKMKRDNLILNEATESGRSKLQRQLKIMLDEAVLVPSRREYYARLIQELNVDTLMLLQRDMRFFDDQN